MPKKPYLKKISNIIIILMVLCYGYPSMNADMINKQNTIENNSLSNIEKSISNSIIEENETIIDPMGDVINLFSGEVVHKHPNIEVQNIDITKLEYNRVDRNVTLSLYVKGKIENRGNLEDLSLFGWPYNLSYNCDSVVYIFSLATSSDYYIIGYINNNCSIIYSSVYDPTFLSKDDINVSGGLLKISFELQTADEIYKEIVISANYIRLKWNESIPDSIYLLDEAPNLPLYANAKGPTWGSVGEEIKFQGVAVFGIPPYSYHWDFGDGGNSTEKNPIHVYKSGGDFVYNLTVTDNSSSSSSDNGIIEIEKRSFVFGILYNKSSEGNYTYFNAKKVFKLSSSPFYFIAYKNNAKLMVFNKYYGLLTSHFIFGSLSIFCIDTRIYTLNIYSRNNETNTIIWLVNSIEGEPVETKDVKMILLSENGTIQPDANITFNEVTGKNRINPGDTFTVIAPFDGYFTFELNYKNTGETIYLSPITKY